MSSDPKKRKTEEDEKNEIIKLDDIQHALHAADFYIGQSVNTTSPEVSRFVYSSEKNLMEYKLVQYPHGLLKLFDEALVNASDNRHRGTTSIKVGISLMYNSIWVHNDGPSFSIVPTDHDSRWDPSQKAYQPEVAFFHCKTSSAYNKKQRITGGKFGLGAKLIAIFSKWCTIEMCDGKTYYFQKSEDHMTKVNPPKVHPSTETPYLSICFKPDLDLFWPVGKAPPKIPDCVLDLFHTRVLDIAGICEGTKVFWALDRDRFIAPKSCTFEKVSVKSFKDYVKLFVPEELKSQLDSGDTNLKIAYHSQPRWQVCMIQNPWPFPVNVSFVNSINTYMGGEHVKYIQSQVYQHCKSKIDGIDVRRVQKSVMLFINATVEDPSFSSQCKETLQTLPSLFGSECNLLDKFFNSLSRNGVMESLKSEMESKELATASRTIGAGKKKSVHDIKNFRDARYAGSRQSNKCTLFFVEGMSALALAEVGISVLGSDYYGAFPVKGKIINADNGIKKVHANDEFKYICRILGLDIKDKDMQVSQLRYGQIVIMTDADPDGSHIRGLLLYMFSKFWPSLLKEEGFIKFMITPIVVAKNKSTTKHFYTLPSFRAWFDGLQNKQSWTIKYYKGLATSTQKEGRVYFKNSRDHIRTFSAATQVDFNMLSMVFNKKEKEAANRRREWLKTFDESKCIPYDQIRQVSIERFLKEDMIHYSWLSVCRAIPACEDGFTPAARKCLWTFLKRGIIKDEKVCTLQSFVDRDTNYHHAADSLGQTIIRMAQTFVGAQNVNLFFPSGQFGTRVDGGDKTVGATRYIFSRLSKITRSIFVEDDDSILPTQEDEGHIIEPVFTAPIIPMILVNGANQVGTAYACKIPCYRPEDLICAIERRLEDKPWEPLCPWYHRFLGEIKGDEKGGFVSKGCVKKVSDKVYHITELPIRVWREDFKSNLTKMVESGKIDSFHERHRNNDIFFDVTLTNPRKDVDPHAFFGLQNKFSPNMNLFMADLKVHSFKSVEELVNKWFDFRLPIYEARRKQKCADLQKQIPFLKSKTDFIRIVISGVFRLGRKKSCLAEDLQSNHNIPAEFHARLFQMDVNSFTEERIEKIEKELADTIALQEFYSSATPQQLWKRDLENLKLELQKFWKEREAMDCDQEDDGN